MLKTSFCIAVALSLITSPVLAKKNVEENRQFTWKEVPGTLNQSEMGNPQSEQIPWHVNTKSLVRRGSTIVFEAISPEAQYLKYEGNCKTNKLQVLYVGEFTSETKLTYEKAPKFWQSRNVTGIQSRVLNFACNASRR